uniref:Asp_protease domain-containing protein n=1 Tax=Strongyloides papillosus TaxID=174720 RepID=A0A0N5BYU9_STREA
MLRLPFEIVEQLDKSNIGDYDVLMIFKLDFDDLEKCLIEFEKLCTSARLKLTDHDLEEEMFSQLLPHLKEQQHLLTVTGYSYYGNSKIEKVEHSKFGSKKINTLRLKETDELKEELEKLRIENNRLKENISTKEYLSFQRVCLKKQNCDEEVNVPTTVDTVTANKPCEILIKVKNQLGRVEYGLLDTRGDTCLMSISQAQSLGFKCRDQDNSIICVLANNQKFKALGYLHTQLFLPKNIKVNCRVVVVDDHCFNQKYKLILGTDLIYAVKTIINYKHREIIMLNRFIPFICSRMEENQKVKVLKFGNNLDDSKLKIKSVKICDQLKKIIKEQCRNIKKKEDDSSRTID